MGGHSVKFHTTAAKTLRHPAAAELEPTGEARTLPGDHGLTIITYTVEPPQRLRTGPELPRELERAGIPLRNSGRGDAPRRRNAW